MTIYICGDSTAATYPPENAPITGWGQLLGDYLQYRQSPLGKQLAGMTGAEDRKGNLLDTRA